MKPGVVMSKCFWIWCGLIGGAEMLAVLPFRGSVTQGKRRRKEHKRRKQEEQIQKRTHATEKTNWKEKRTLQRICASKQQLTSKAMPQPLGNRSLPMLEKIKHATTYAHHFSLVWQTPCGWRQFCVLGACLFTAVPKTGFAIQSDTFGASDSDTCSSAML